MKQDRLGEGGVLLTRSRVILMEGYGVCLFVDFSFAFATIVPLRYSNATIMVW